MSSSVASPTVATVVVVMVTVVLVAVAVPVPVPVLRTDAYWDITLLSTVAVLCLLRHFALC